MLSSIVTFFQTRCRFDSEANPGLDSRIRHLALELENIDYEKQNHIWGALGTNYLPSVIYRVRLVTIQAAELDAEAAPIEIADIREA